MEKNTLPELIPALQLKENDIFSLLSSPDLTYRFLKWKSKRFKIGVIEIISEKDALSGLIQNKVPMNFQQTKYVTVHHIRQNTLL